MIRDEGRWLELTDRFHTAAIDGKGWHGALEGLAEATGSKSGELICIAPDRSVTLNIMTNTSPELLDAFIRCNGGDPDVNPRVKAGMQAPLLKVLAESDFITPEEHKRHPHYQSFARPFDIPYICLATLDRKAGGLTGLAVTRTEREGHISSEQRRVFELFASHVRAAVRSHEALEGYGDALVTGALEAISIPAFICDETGRVRAQTPSTEAVLKGPGGLQLKAGRLGAPLLAEAQALTDAIANAASGLKRSSIAPRNRTVLVRRSEGDTRPLVLDVIALPRRRFEFAFTARVLVLVRGESADTARQRRATLLQAVYGLTAAETDIALQLFAGRSAEDIAQSRAVTVQTVRTQIKSLLAKSGARRQVELVAQLGQM